MIGRDTSESTPYEKCASSFPSAEGVRVREEFYTPHRKQERHSHQHTNISLILAGSVEETVGAAVEHAFALSLVVKPGGTEHANKYGAKGAQMLSVLLKPDLQRSLNNWDTGVARWRWMHGGPAVQWMLRLLGTYRRRHTSASTNFEDCLCEVLASLPSGQSSNPTTSPPRWLELVKEELDDTFAEGHRVRDLARHARVHPVYLARQFRRYIGCSITDYRTFLRARAAAELLASSDEPLVAAAVYCGFVDQSHLCRVFKGATGLTPRDYRRLTKGPGK
jgi:AraC family transcriptional regulator